MSSAFTSPSPSPSKKRGSKSSFPLREAMPAPLWERLCKFPSERGYVSSLSLWERVRVRALNSSVVDTFHRIVNP